MFSCAFHHYFGYLENPDINIFSDLSLQNLASVLKQNGPYGPDHDTDAILPRLSKLINIHSFIHSLNSDNRISLVLLRASFQQNNTGNILQVGSFSELHAHEHFYLPNPDYLPYPMLRKTLLLYFDSDNIGHQQTIRFPNVKPN